MSLSEQADGLWSAFLVGLVVSRQNGKGSVLEARELAGLFLLDEALGLHSAHEFKTCYEHFLRITQLIEGCPDLDRQVQKVRRGVGEQAIELRNGNRLRFVARSSGSGRGFSADLVVLDEAYALTDAQIGAIMPTLSARPNPQVWYTSSAPMEASLPLHRLRQSAIDHDADRLYYAEWGNDADADPWDEKAIAQANPALGRRLFLDFVDAERDAMSSEEFARERLGVPEKPVGSDGPIDAARWQELIDAAAQPTADSVRLSLDAPPDRRTATFSAAGKLENGLLYVERRDHLHPERMRDLSARAKELCDGHGTNLLIPAGSPALAWKADLEAAGVTVEVMPPAECSAAFGYLLSQVNEGTLRHRGQPELNNAVAGLTVKRSGDVDVPARRTSSTNIAPFIAAMCALYRVPTAPPKTKIEAAFAVT